MKRQKHMLVTRFSALGDVAMTIPAVYSLATAYPDLKITFLTRPFFCNLFINKPENITVLPVDFKTEYKGIKGKIRLLRLIRSLGIDCVADLHNVSRSWLIDAAMVLRGTKVAMVDKMRAARRKLIRDKVPQESFINRYCDVFRRLGYPVTLSFKSLYQNTVPNPPVSVFQAAVGIAPFARYDTKICPPQTMRQTAKILADSGISVYLFGGRGAESEQLAAWESDSPLIHSVAGKFKITDELALMSSLDLMVSMDSANQHLAALAGTRVLTVWGGTTPGAGFAAYNSNADDAVCLDLPCQPCSVAGLPQCPLGTKECMTRITAQMLSDKIKTIIVQ